MKSAISETKVFNFRAVKRFIVTALTGALAITVSSLVAAEPSGIKSVVTAPFDGKPKYPFTKRDALQCGRWRSESLDLPYFGAPRDGNARKHAGVDLYPDKGAGTPVKAILDGIVIKVAPFYTRKNGEITYGILIDHGEFVANYSELRKPTIKSGAKINQRQVIGYISGTKQLHFDLYTKGTTDWAFWYKDKPENLLDPTPMMVEAFSIGI